MMSVRKLLVVPLLSMMFLVFAPSASAWMADLCISFGGHNLYESGTANCSTSSGWNFAAAVGSDSSATVDG